MGFETPWIRNDTTVPAARVEEESVNKVTVSAAKVQVRVGLDTAENKGFCRHFTVDAVSIDLC
jgi:hypothetical protein